MKEQSQLSPFHVFLVVVLGVSAVVKIQNSIIFRDTAIKVALVKFFCERGSNWYTRLWRRG